MCIFNKDVVVESTQILAGNTEDGKKILAYSNNVTADDTAFMLLPIPTHNIESVTFYDTTEYKTFLNDISTAIQERENIGMRGIGVQKSLEQVGQYRMSMVAPENLIMFLIYNKQAIPSWLYRMNNLYSSDFNWLSVEIQKGDKLSNQPLLITYEQSIRKDELYYPMMDVHGDESIKSHVYRNHILSVGEKDKVNYLDIPFNDSFPFKDLRYEGFTGKGNIKNGDFWARKEGNDWKFYSTNLWVS